MPNPIPGTDDILRKELDNGIVVLVRENFEAQSVIIHAAFAGGMTFEPRDKHGVAALTAEALLRGTHKRDYAELHETLESFGMSLDFEGGRFLTAFTGKSLAEDLPKLVDIATDALRNPTFPENHVDLIKAEALTGLRYSQQDTRYMANKFFRELAYPTEHVLHYSPSGEIETIEALTVDDLHAYHQAQYGPGEMIVVVVGAVKGEDAVRIVEDHLGDWHNGEQQTDYSQPSLLPKDQIELNLHVLQGKTQSDIVLGVPGASRFDEDFQAARMANNVLGVFGMMGRLGANVREKKGLAYYSYSGMSGGLSNAAWKVAAGVSPKDVQDAIDSIRLEIDQMINTPITADDLADNQANFTGRLPLLLESNTGVATNIMSMERYKMGLDYLRNYHDMIMSITVEDVQAAMQRYWGNNAMSISVAGPQLSDSIKV